MIVRYLEYLVALSRERHFARAAAACNVTQPTLSAGLKQLEDSLGVLIVERRRRFVRFTPEGERVLAWAQRMLADYSSLAQELDALKGGLAGQIRIGMIPVSLPVSALLTTAFAALHPQTRFQIVSRTSVEIQRGLDDFSIDAGVTYLDNEPLAHVRAHPLYTEKYVLIAREQRSDRLPERISWAEAAAHPLCLLTPDMQNRRIIDAQLRAAGVQVRPVVETNSLITLWSHIRYGNYASIVPHTALLLLERFEGLVVAPLIEPEATHVLGLVATDRDPLSSLTAALFESVRALDLQALIESRVSAHLAKPTRAVRRVDRRRR